MVKFASLVGGILLIGIVAFCTYGFLSAPEAPADMVWSFRLLYGIIGVASLVGAGWLLARLRRPGH